MSVLEIWQAIAWERQGGRPLCKDPVQALKYCKFESFDRQPECNYLQTKPEAGKSILNGISMLLRSLIDGLSLILSLCALRSISLHFHYRRPRGTIPPCSSSWLVRSVFSLCRMRYGPESFLL